jgi:hypothetical protein
VKRISYIIIALFMFTVAIAAQTQNAAGSGTNFSFPHAPIVHSFKMSGLELTPGTFDTIDDKRWGNVYMIAGGDAVIQTQLTISVDYVSGNPDPASGNLVTSGTWSLAIYQGGKYSGSIFGDIIAGALTWGSQQKNQIDAGILKTKLQIVGGTGDFAFVGPSTGSLVTTTDYAAVKPTTTAVFSLAF